MSVSTMAEVITKPYGRITNMVAKELRLIFKDKVALFLIFLLPAVLIGMMYFVIEESSMGNLQLDSSTDVEDGGEEGDPFGGSNLTLGLVDLDTTRTFDGDDLSEELTDIFRNMSDLTIFEDEETAFQALYDKVVTAYVVIPDGFEANLTINEPTYIEVHVDATDMLGQGSVLGVIQGGTILFRAGHLWIRSEVFPAMVIEFTPQGSYIATIFGAFIVIFSSYLGIAMTAAQSIVGDTPLRRMLLTPTNRLEVILAKVLGYLVIGFFQSLFLVSLWVVTFDLTMNTGFESLIFIMSLTSLTGSTTGILISAIASSRLQANQMFLFILFATIILAGFFIDVGWMDEVLPMNQGMAVLIDTAFKGLTLVDTWPSIAKLLGFSIGATLAATFIFSKKPTLD